VTWCTSLRSTRIVKMSGWPESPDWENTIRAPLGENEADSNIESAQSVGRGRAPDLHLPGLGRLR
jgi:hypothetical protein